MLVAWAHFVWLEAGKMVDVGVFRVEKPGTVMKWTPLSTYSRTVGKANKCSRANDAVGFFYFVCVVAVYKPAECVLLRHRMFPMRKAD